MKGPQDIIYNIDLRVTFQISESILTEYLSAEDKNTTELVRRINSYGESIVRFIETLPNSSVDKISARIP